MKDKKSVNEYMESLPPEEKEALQKIRKMILSINPGFEERMSSGAPFFWYRGKRAIGLRATKDRLSFFIMHGNVLQTHKEVYKEYDSSTTVVYFKPNRPLTPKILTTLVTARMEEIDNSMKK